MSEDFVREDFDHDFVPHFSRYHKHFIWSPKACISTNWEICRYIIDDHADHHARWYRRWPFMSVVVGKYFISDLHMKRLKQKVRHSLRRRIALQHFFRMRGKPIPLKTPEQRRNYYMIVIFSCEPLLRNIVSYL